MKTQKHDEIWNEEQLARILNFEPEVLEKRAAPETGVGERATNQFENEVGVGEVGRFEQGLDEPVHTESSDGIVGNISQKNVASDNTQLSQADMFDEPHEGKTKPTFAANPFAKGGAVGLGLLVLFATAGLFLNSIMGTKLAKAPSKSAAPENSKVQQQNTSTPPNEIGDYKTQAALSSQAQRLKAVEDARNNRAPNNLQRPEKPGQQNRPNNTAPPSSAARPTPSSSRPASSGAPIPASRSMATPAPRPTSTPASSTPTPTPVSRPAPSTPAATPVPRPTQSTPAPTSPQSPTPVSRPAASTSAPTPVSRPASSSPTQETPTRPVETAEERWQRLAHLGAYNAVGEGDPSNGIIPGVNVGTNRGVNTAFNPAGYPGVNLNNQPALSGSNIPVQNTPLPVTLAGVPVAHSISPSPVDSTSLSSELTPPELVVSRQPLSEEEQAILSETPQTTEENVPASEVESTSTDVIDTGFLEPAAYDEAASINPNTVGIADNNFIKVGQLVPGQLVTPVAAIDSGNRQSQTGNIAQRFVVALSNPLLASDGAVLFPASSQVVFEVKNVQKNGLVEAVGVALIDGQVEYRLPTGAISIRGRNGEPLIAERRRDDSGLFGRDLQTFGLGAAAKVGEVLNRPQRESSYSGFGGGGSTVERGSPNILGAVLEGGFSPVLESNTRRNERAIQEIESRPPLWYIEQGKGVQVFINSSFQLQQS